MRIHTVINADVIKILHHSKIGLFYKNHPFKVMQTLKINDQSIISGQVNAKR